MHAYLIDTLGMTNVNVNSFPIPIDPQGDSSALGTLFYLSCTPRSKNNVISLLSLEVLTGFRIHACIITWGL